MEILKEKKGVLIIVGLLTAVVLAAVLLANTGSIKVDNIGNKQSKIEAQKNGSDDKLIVYRDGRVEVYKDGNSFTDYWSSDKVSAYYRYLSEAHSAELDDDGNGTVNYDVDELIDSIIDGSSGGSGGDDDAGQDIDDFFNTPTPNPTGNGNNNNNSPSPTSTTNPGQQPWCLFWRLSYCVIAYTPPPSGTPDPEEGILPPDCNENSQTGRTVIGNELCLPSAIPTPNE